MKNKLITLIMIITVMLLVTACSNDGRDISMYDLQKSMLSVDTSLSNLKTVNKSGDETGDMFAYISDISYDKVKDYYLAYASKAANNTDEIAVIQMKSAEDAQECMNTLQKHLDSRIAMYQSYNPKMVENLENAILYTKDEFAVLIVCKGQNLVKAAFEDFIKDK